MIYELQAQQNQLQAIIYPQPWKSPRRRIVLPVAS